MDQKPNAGPSVSTWAFYIISVIVLLVAYPVLISTWINLKVQPTVETRDYLFLVQVTLTFLATVGVGILSVANARSTILLQAQLTTKTEELKADLLEGVNDKTETLKAELLRETDYLKTRLSEIIPKEHEAYHSMWKSADAYFRAFQDLEVGEFPERKLKKADEYNDDALGKSLLVNNDDCNAYYNFLGEVDILKDSASKDRGRPSDLQNLWKENYKKFGASYMELKERFSARLRGT